MPLTAPPTVHRKRNAWLKRKDALMSWSGSYAFTFMDIVAFLVLEVLSCLEVDGMAEVLPLFENTHDDRRTPGIGEMCIRDRPNSSGLRTAIYRFLVHAATASVSNTQQPKDKLRTANCNSQYPTCLLYTSRCV